MRLAALLFSTLTLFSLDAAAQPRSSAPMQKGPVTQPAQNQPAQNLSSAQVQASMDALRQSILQARPTTTGPRVKNPKAASAQSAMLVVLGRQKQSAMEDRAKMITAPKLHLKTSQDIKVVPHTTTPAGGNTNIQVVPHTTTPSGGGTEIKVQPGVHGPPPQNIGIDPSLCGKPQINIVNRQAQPKDVVFTPEPQYNQYSISGCKFGDQQGELHIYGHFKSQIIKMNVEFWSDSMIMAAVDPSVSGEIDQDGVTLAVKPVGAPQMQLGGFRFYAARETVLLPSMSQKGFQRSDCQMDSVDYSSPATDGGTVHMVRTGTHGLPTGRCINGSDFYSFHDLSPGFFTDSFQYSYAQMTQSECNAKGFGRGTVDNAGVWEGQWGDDKEIIMAFRVQECATPNPFLGQAPIRLDVSNYWLSVWVTGPRGVSPRP